jgi:hypothetical protein
LIGSAGRAVVFVAEGPLERDVTEEEPWTGWTGTRMDWCVTQSNPFGMPFHAICRVDFDIAWITSAEAKIESRLRYRHHHRQLNHMEVWLAVGKRRERVDGS